jgi:hypothetical protein
MLLFVPGQHVLQRNAINYKLLKVMTMLSPEILRCHVPVSLLCFVTRKNTAVLSA